MRRLPAILIAVLTAASLATGVATADSQTVRGDRFGGTVGDITKMTVDNARKAVTTKVFGIGRPCTGAKSLDVYVETSRGKIGYFAQGVCTAAVQWNTTLYYTPTGDIQDQRRVRCANFGFTRVKSTGAFEIVMPRGCLDKAPDRIRVEADGMNWGSVSGGHAGPTKVLGRG